MMTAPAAKADDYCITNGAQAAHGCGYPTMEACRQAANGGIGGSCSQAGGAKKPRRTRLPAEADQTNPRLSQGAQN